MDLLTLLVRKVIYAHFFVKSIQWSSLQIVRVNIPWDISDHGMKKNECHLPFSSKIKFYKINVLICDPSIGQTNVCQWQVFLPRP